MTQEIGTSYHQIPLNINGVSFAGVRSIMPEKAMEHVERNVIPVWLRQRVRKFLKGDPRRSIRENARASFDKARLPLDHYGTIEQGSIFVIEPYATVDDYRSEAEVYAYSIHCDLVISAESYHFPPKTIRLAFIPRLLFHKLLDPKVVTPRSKYDPSRTSRTPPID